MSLYAVYVHVVCLDLRHFVERSPTTVQNMSDSFQITLLSEDIRIVCRNSELHLRLSNSKAPGDIAWRTKSFACLAEALNCVTYPVFASTLEMEVQCSSKSSITSYKFTRRGSGTPRSESPSSAAFVSCPATNRSLTESEMHCSHYYYYNSFNCTQY
jgi:hypothetical protein